MKKLLQRLGVIAWWALLPGLVVYLSRGPRTRIVVQSGGKVAVVKGWLGNGKWSLPGGGLHKGESPAAGVLREAREETGLLIDPATVRPLVVAPYSAYGIHFSCHYFAAELPGQITLKPQLMEIAEVAWLDPRMLTARNANTDVLTALRFARGQSRALLQ